ncbi:beta family protein [Xanthomonas sacchari]|uniref:beta family protein n=1 Tax=Xanthomonas sacchari TaxID=56458 RepID=UPI00225E1A37|nr:beta family protein [Xanthomonas sacchari]UYK80392.1 beta family protein [Xanthomonas sacchari]
MRNSKFDAFRYAPIIEVRPAEMLALETLPEKDKDLLAPVLKLRPWAASLELNKSIGRVKSAYGGRPCFLALAELDFSEVTRPVHIDLRKLADPRDGFRAWCAYFENEGNSQFIPCAQITHPEEFLPQVKSLAKLNRGLGIVVESEALPYAENIAERLLEAEVEGDVMFMLDYGKQNAGLVNMASLIRDRLAKISKIIPNATLSISASSFPDGFVGVESQAIFERQAYNFIKGEMHFPLIYSDRGSARAERQLGGGGAPAPRVDYADDNWWYFYRSGDESKKRLSRYQEMAKEVMKSPQWDPKLRIWGTQMIERTALGDENAITSPPRATAARINIHLHRQLHYGDRSGLYDTEDEWVD